MSSASKASAHFELVRCVGEGAFGSVHAAVDTRTGKEVAIKVINLEAGENEIEEVQKEIKVLGGCGRRRVRRVGGKGL